MAEPTGSSEGSDAAGKTEFWQKFDEAVWDFAVGSKVCMLS